MRAPAPRHAPIRLARSTGAPYPVTCRHSGHRPVWPPPGFIAGAVANGEGIACSGRRGTGPGRVRQSSREQIDVCSAAVQVSGSRARRGVVVWWIRASGPALPDEVLGSKMGAWPAGQAAAVRGHPGADALPCRQRSDPCPTLAVAAAAMPAWAHGRGQNVSVDDLLLLATSPRPCQPERSLRLLARKSLRSLRHRRHKQTPAHSKLSCHARVLVVVPWP